MQWRGQTANNQVKEAYLFSMKFLSAVKFSNGSNSSECAC